MAKPSAFARLKANETSARAELASASNSATPVKQANRIGMKTVIFYDVPEAVRELKRVAVDHDRTIQNLMQEALDDLLVKYGKHAFGRRP